MNQSSQEQPELPVWARVDLFKPKPNGSGSYGIDTLEKGPIPCDSLEELDRLYREHEGGLVWTPEDPLLVVAEEVPSLLEAVKEVSKKHAKKVFKVARTQLFIFLALFVILLIQYLPNWMQMFKNPSFGMLGIFFLMFGLMPLYESWKMKKAADKLDLQGLQLRAKEVRFEIWLRRQQAPATKILIGALVLAYVFQFLAEMGLPDWQKMKIIEQAGLNKPRYHAGEYWRLLTAPFLHGYFGVHLFFNASALWFLGKRLEVMAKWPHLLLCFLVSMIVGGIVSAWYVPAPSIGASGGVLGLLGFLIVFETLHIKLVPKPARRRLLGGVIGMIAIGVIGFQFIDNGAHGGGLVAGMIYAFLVFPKSSSVYRPKLTTIDFIFGVIAAFVLAASMTLAIQVMSQQ